MCAAHPGLAADDAPGAGGLDDRAIQKVVDGTGARRDGMLRKMLEEPYPPEGMWRHEDFALAAYWLNERTADADQGIIIARNTLYADSVKAQNGFHWHAYLLERIYFLFGSTSKHFPKRMGPQAEKALLEMLWEWAAPNCRREMTLSDRDWWRWGSENHHAQAWASFWGAAHVFAQHPDYRERRYADGTTPAEMAAAFDAYYKRYARNHASRGMLVECNSDYNKYTLGGWYNIADFAADPALRKQMTMLLDLYWADWAIEQIDGVRGGSRHRSYTGETSTARTAGIGAAYYHFGLGVENNHPGFICAATSFYRPSPVVVDLALDVAGRGTYAYLSRRAGLAGSIGRNANFVQDPKNLFFEPKGVYSLDPNCGALLRYTWCTPEFVMGTSMVEARPREDWTAISAQNRWEGVIFGGHPTARIFVQALQPEKGSFYNAYWSVQNQGVLIVQRLKGSNAKGNRVWFDASMKRVERDGWVFVEAPRAYAAVRAAWGETAWEADAVEQHRGGAGSLDRGQWLKCEEFAPVIIEVAGKSQLKDFQAFQSAVLGGALSVKDQRLEYRSATYSTTLTLSGDYSTPPTVDGKAVNYAYPKSFDSPFIQSDFASGVVTIQKGARRLVLDFNKAE